MASLVKRIWGTVSTPRAVTGLALSLYLISFGLGTYLLTAPEVNVLWEWIPTYLILAGSTIAFGCAWRGGLWGRTLEKPALALLAGGLITGAIVEIHDLLLIKDVAGTYTFALLLIAVVLAISRTVWLTTETRRIEREVHQAIRAAALER